MARSSYNKSADKILHTVGKAEAGGKRLKVFIRSYDGGEMKASVEQIKDGKQTEGFGVKRFTADQLEAVLEHLADALVWMRKQEQTTAETSEEQRKAS